MLRSCAIVIVLPPLSDVPAVPPVDPAIVLPVVSPEVVAEAELPVVVSVDVPSVLAIVLVDVPLPVVPVMVVPLPAPAEAVSIVLQSCLTWFCCSAVSFDQVARISFRLRNLDIDVSENSASPMGRVHFDVVLFSASVICIMSVPGCTSSRCCSGCRAGCTSFRCCTGCRAGTE